MSGLGIAALAILGPAGLFLLVAIVLRLRARQHRYSLSELGDLSRDDIDPGWPEVRDTLPGDDEQAPGGGQ